MSSRWTIPQSVNRDRRPRRTGRLEPDLALRVLRATTRLAQTDLLALDLARIARHETGLAQRLAEPFIVVHQRPRDAVADGAGLARRAAAADGDVKVELALGLGDRQGLTHDHARGLATEKLVQWTAVDHDGAVARLHENARGGGFATARAVVDFGGHRLELQGFRLLRGVGMLGAAHNFEFFEH